MSIVRVQITNYKSIRRCALPLNNVNLLIGENGTGKSNMLDAVRYFYQSLLQEGDDRGCYNHQNAFCNEFSIAVTFDFTHLQKIAGNHQQRDAEPEYAGYYGWILRRQRQETLRLRKVRGQPIRWNRGRQYRQNIRHLFPIYFVDARSVNLTDWGQLWSIIGDLMKVHQSREAEISRTINTLRDDQTYRLGERFEKLSEAFRQANIQIKPFTPQEYASAISSLLFRGSVFSFQENRLDDFSNGTNAFNYTNLLIEILKLMAQSKVKDPLVILDEPEISLHHKLVDQLTGRIFGCEGAIRFLVATHSPRLLKNVIKAEQSDCEVIHVSVQNGHTRAAPVTLFSREANDARPRVFMTDQHANAYFSRYILSVEGASEMEVFSNAWLQEVFPVLRHVDIMEGMSDDIVQRIISPRQRHFQTRFLLLMDMDKAVMRRKGGNRFDLVGKYFSESKLPQETYYYSAKRTEQYQRLRRIRAMAQRCRFHYWYPFYASTDPAYREFLQLIRAYLLERNLYVASTTVEGMLITRENLKTFWAYCQTRPAMAPAMPQLQKAYDGFFQNDRLNFVRLLFRGKSDFILNLDEIIACNPGFDPALRRLMESSRAQKTDGWISQWLEFYFCRAAGLEPDGRAAFARFRKQAADEARRYLLRRAFSLDFPELYAVLQTIEKQLNL